MSKTPYLRENDEEVYNALTHAVGFGLFIAGTIAVSLKGWQIDPLWGIAGFIYGFFQTMTYFSSTVYHIISSPGRRTTIIMLNPMAFWVTQTRSASIEFSEIESKINGRTHDFSKNVTDGVTDGHHENRESCSASLGWRLSLSGESAPSVGEYIIIPIID